MTNYIKKLSHINYKLQDLASKFMAVPPKLENRTRKWYKKKLEIFLDDQDSELYSKKLSSYFKIEGYDENLIDGLTIRLYWPAYIREKIPPKEFIKTYEREVLNPIGYQIVDQHIHSLGRKAVLNVTNLKARTKYVKKPRFLYHFTHSKQEGKILKKGLVPKDGPGDFSYKMYKSRIYLIAQDPKQWGYDILDIIPFDSIKDVIIFRIDTRKFNRFNIFQDSEYRDNSAVWTPTHIPANALKVVFRATENTKFSEFFNWAKNQ